MRTYDVPKLLEKLGIEYQKRGRELWACCPLPGHEEADASWSILDQPGGERHGHWSCFGCQRGGGPVALVADVRGYSSFASSHEWMREHGIEVDETSPLPTDVGVVIAEPKRRSFCMPAGVSFGPLSKWPTPIREYTVARGVDAAQVERWGIGYAVDGRLSGRIVIPVRDRAGKLASYQARAWDGSRLRYLTPDSKDGADWSVVFGEQWWSGGVGEVALTEGSLNALACERAGASQVAALGGSKIAPEIFDKLSRFSRVLVVSDPDAAGARVASAAGVLARYTQVVRVRLPRGKDANDLATGELAKLLERCRRVGDGSSPPRGKVPDVGRVSEKVGR